MKYKHILVPYDGSDNAKAALAEAVDLARSGSGVTLVIGTVCQIAATAGRFDMASELGREQERQLRSKSEAILEEGLALVPEGIAVDSAVGVGSPGPILQAIAEKKGCDLIVMGSRGMGQVKGFFMGSVSSWLATHAKCSVLIVK